MTQYIEQRWMETWSCGECGVVMAIDQTIFSERRRNGKGFWCFNGHSRIFRETEEDRLNKKLARETQIREAAEARARTAESERTAITKAHVKMRTRVMNGVCPCCSRTFQNLMAHMKTEHPDFMEKSRLHTLRVAFGMSQDVLAKEAGVKPAHVSAYERDKPLARYAKHRLESWIEKHQKENA